MVKVIDNPSTNARDKDTALYEHDFHAWTQAQAALLKAGRLNEIDLDNLIEEIESMGASQRRELYSRLRVLVLHLLKWKYQPQARSSGWRGTIRTQRYEISLLLEQSPSLKNLVLDALTRAYPNARVVAADESGLPLSVFPETCPFTPEQISDEGYWPD